MIIAAIFIWLYIGASFALIASSSDIIKRNTRSNFDGLFGLLLISWPIVLLFVPFILMVEEGRRRFDEEAP